MASSEHQKEYSALTPARRKTNMKRGKPHQQIYRPGSGPLRKSNNIDESESDTNLVLNSRQQQQQQHHNNPSRWKSEGGSPRDIDQTSARLRDISLNIDNSKRFKKPEQMLYVPRAVVQAREAADRDSSPHIVNGNENLVEANNRNFPTRTRADTNRVETMEKDIQKRDWREQSPSGGRTKRNFDHRGTTNDPSHNWHRTRDTRSVEPTGITPAPTMRTHTTTTDKIQSKPPSGRRHSTVGIEQEKRFSKTFDNLPPRLQKKFLAENNIQAPEDNWDGSSVTFQSHSKTPNYHPVGGDYYTLPSAHNAPPAGGFAYHTLPSRPRGRGRFTYDHHDLALGSSSSYNGPTPERIGSPGESRPPTPPAGASRKPDSRPQTPVSVGGEYQNAGRGRQRSENRCYDNASKESAPRHQDRRDNNNINTTRRRGDFDNNRRYDYGREDKFHHRRDKDTWDENTPRATPDRELSNNRRDHAPSDRHSHSYHHHHHPVRENRGRGRGGGYNRDRRRYNNGDGRRERDVRGSRSNTGGGRRYEENWGGEESVNDVEGEVGQSSEVQLSAEDKIEPLFGQASVHGTILDWSEEVELNDRLEAEYLSDALTRSSSVVSLQEVSTKSLPPNLNTQPESDRSKRKNRRRSRNRSSARDNSYSRNNNNNTTNRSRQNSTTSIDSRDDNNFKVPSSSSYDSRPRRRSRDQRENSFDRYQNSSSRNLSRDSSWERNRSTNLATAHENWREEIVRSRTNSERGEKDGKDTVVEDIKNVDGSLKKAGVLVLPQQNEVVKSVGFNVQELPRYPESSRRSPAQQKSLFDPNNPSKPIVVKSSSSRASVPGFTDNTNTEPTLIPPQMYTTDQFGNVRPAWYEETSEEFHSCHYPQLLRDIKRADNDIQTTINHGLLLVHWDLVDNLRHFLKEALEFLLCKAIKFCQSENVEQHFWKLLYHNIIEVTRKAIKHDANNKEKYREFLLYLIDEGGGYFERLLGVLEETYQFKLSSFMGENINNMASHKGLGLVGLALVSAQKLFLFLGDLGRYREEVNETSNYGKCRQWYIKSHEINPKNGKPYNQLAILAVYARRKLDAVYYYMRSLMSSNPVPSARQNLISLFDENRKKYEQGEKKRREERLERQRQQMKQKESDDSDSAPGSLRKETWIHPDGGRRVHRTTQAQMDQNESDSEDLSALTSVELNKRFVISYLHVHGKLITNIGMETFHETAMQMLKEFRALLQHSPVPLPCNRFLQLLALNMFAIESTQLKDPQLQSQPGYRSELQERALVISLQMFNLILERCVSILQEHISTHEHPTDLNSLPQDGHVLLPAIKIWCDWMLCHTVIWNPPPSTQDFRIGSPGDAWSRLATLMNLMEQMDQSGVDNFLKEPREGYEQVRLPEDSVLYGFTPLMYTAQEAVYAPKDVDIEAVHSMLRLSKLIFFGTVYLCGVDPPVLKLEIEDGVREYVSAVCAANSRDSPPVAVEMSRNDDVLLESFSDEDEESPTVDDVASCDAPTEIRDLLTRKVELEKRKRNQDLHMQRVKKILSQSVVSVHMEVRPKNLVPDTNCFIDHLDGIRTIAQSHCYTLMVPIVVLSELEGLSRGGKSPAPDSRLSLNPQHVKKVAKHAKDALDFLKTRHSSLKCVTTKGVILPSTTFSTEDDTTWDNSLRNDDKILTTCLVLCKGHKGQLQQEIVDGEPRHLERDVVLLTDDRNLRVKAHARDVPVRELSDFMRWAGLG